MRVIAKAIADRQSEIERLEAEIKALNEVDKILGTSAPPAKPAARKLLLAADGGCGHPGRGDPARRQADEEAPYDVGRREECGVRADDRLLGRAQKESREVARLRRAGGYVPHPAGGGSPDEPPREVNRSPVIRPTAVCLRGSRSRRGSERCSSPPRGSPGVRPRTRGTCPTIPTARGRPVDGALLITAFAPLMV